MRSWKKTPTKLIKEENRLYQKLRALIRKKNKEIMREFKKLDRVPSSDMEIKTLIAPIAEAKRGYSDIVMENTQEAIRAGMERTKTELKRQGLGKGKNSNLMFYLNGSLKLISPELDFEEFSQEVSDRIRQDSFIASGQTIDRMSGDVMDNIKESYEAGYGIDKAAVNLQDVFDDMEDWELKRVARTEINGAQNLGAEATMRQMGVVYDKWKTAGDARVRGNRPEDTADHKYMDGQISYVSGNFSNGLSRPGDRSGPIKEWIQCRCVLLPYLIPEGYAAPSMSFFYESDLVKIEVPEPGKIPKPGAKPKPGLKPEIKKSITRPKLANEARDEIDKIKYDTRSRIEILEGKRSDALARHKRVYDSQPMKGTEEFKLWEIELQKAREYSWGLGDEVRALEMELRHEIHEKVLQVSKTGYKIDPHIPKGFGKEGIKNINKGTKEFSKLVDKKLWPEDTGLFMKKLPEGGRAGQVGQSINLTNTDTPRVIIHEMGHFLEEHSPGIHTKVQAFYDARTAGEKAKWLGRGYKKHEIYKADKFIDKYMGKVYDDGTEILSMGLEYFYNEPVKLATKDPEMFDFIYNLVRGIE